MKLSIIVTNYQTSDLLKLCLESIKKAAQSIDHEIIVVDSEAQEETQDMMKEIFPDIRLISFKKNVGYAKVVNRGLREIKGYYVFILNSDMVLMLDSLRQMIDFLDGYPAIGMVGPQLLNFDGSIQNSCFRFHRLITIPLRRTFLGKTTWGRKELARFLIDDFDRQSFRDVDWILGAALMIKKEALDKVGAMDERFFLYFEDTDWCRRFWQAGWQVVYFPQAKMHHYHGRMSKKTKGIGDLFFNKYTWIHIWSALKYFWKYRNKINQSFAA